MEIMSAYSSRLGKVCGLGCSLVFSASGLLASDLILQKVPPLTVEQAPAYPQNLARYDLGAQVEAVPSKPIANLRLSSTSGDRNTADAALLCHDPTIEYALPAGQTEQLLVPGMEGVIMLSTGDLSDQGAAAPNPWRCQVQFQNGFQLDITLRTAPTSKWPEV